MMFSLTSSGTELPLAFVSRPPGTRWAINWSPLKIIGVFWNSSKQRWLLFVLFTVTAFKRVLSHFIRVFNQPQIYFSTYLYKWFFFAKKRMQNNMHFKAKVFKEILREWIEERERSWRTPMAVMIKRVSIGLGHKQIKRKWDQRS